MIWRRSIHFLVSLVCCASDFFRFSWGQKRAARRQQNRRRRQQRHHNTSDHTLVSHLPLQTEWKRWDTTGAGFISCINALLRERPTAATAYVHCVHQAPPCNGTDGNDTILNSCGRVELTFVLFNLIVRYLVNCMCSAFKLIAGLRMVFYFVRFVCVLFRPNICNCSIF